MLTGLAMQQLIITRGGARPKSPSHWPIHRWLGSGDPRARARTLYALPELHWQAGRVIGSAGFTPNPAPLDVDVADLVAAQTKTAARREVEDGRHAGRALEGMTAARAGCARIACLAPTTGAPIPAMMDDIIELCGGVGLG